MESKPKACCANCEWCDKNGYKCKRSGAFVEKWIFCTYYHGNGITPAQEIEELNKKYVKLKGEFLDFLKWIYEDKEKLPNDSKGLPAAYQGRAEYYLQKMAKGEL